MFKDYRRVSGYRILLSLVLTALLFASFTGCGGDDDDDSSSSGVGDIVISDVWSRPTQLIGAIDNQGTAEEDSGSMDMGVTNAAVYMTIENQGDTDDVLLSASTGIADAAELHTVNMDNGVMQMRPVEGGIEIPAGGSEMVVLEPGGLHMMLIGINRSTEEGDAFDVDLVFEKAGSITVEVEVREQ